MKNPLMATLATFVVLTPILVSCSQNTDTTLPVPTSAATTTIVPTATTRPPEPQCGNGETPQWLNNEETWLCPAVTTTTQRPSPPDCEGHTEAKWQSAKWQCVRMSSAEAGLTCNRIENLSWDSETSLWSCAPDTSMLRRCEDTVSMSVDAGEGSSDGYRRSANDIRKAGLIFRLVEITGRLDSENVCTAEGIEYDYVVCSNDKGWMYIRPIREIDKDPVVNGSRICLNGIRSGTGETLFTPEDSTAPASEPCDDHHYLSNCFRFDTTTSDLGACDAGLIDRTDSSGTPKCLLPPDCGSSLVAIYVSESGRYVCSETEETASQFWEYIFPDLDTLSDFTKARYIGGLGATYNKNIWREDMAVLGEDYEGGLEVWAYQNQASASEHLERISEGTSHVHICYEHDCLTAENLIGSTDVSVSLCVAIVWHTEEGLWFIMRIDESVPVCVRAFERVVSGEINGASVGYSQLSEDTGRTAPKDEIERPVYYEYDVEFEEITLTFYPYPPADNDTWVAAIDLRE